MEIVNLIDAPVVRRLPGQCDGIVARLLPFVVIMLPDSGSPVISF